MAKKKGKRIYYFGATRTDGRRSMRDLLGGKGANLAEMTSIGLPVPPGFTISTESCGDFEAAGQRLPAGLMDDVRKHMRLVEREAGKRFGAEEAPLLVSVRSGAAVSMPGMMDTVLNLGLNDASAEGLARGTGNRRFALDAYRRLINMYGNVVMGVKHEHFESAFDKVKRRHRAKLDTDLDEDGLVELVSTYKKVYSKQTGGDFPQDPYVQLEQAIEAVFRSWNTPRAISYRQINNITGLLGTAVNVQAMVFGNMGDDSATGVAFTRNPATGENELYGEFLVNAQGEDVVAGIRNPKPVAEMEDWDAGIYKQLVKAKSQLEKHYGDMQDIEYTVENRKLYILQTRDGKRAGPAAVKIAVDMVRERRINKREALLRVPAGDLTQLLLPSFDPKARREVLTRGVAASPGAASGYPVFSAEEAVERHGAGQKVILVRKETSPEDVDGMHAAEGILTATGGTTSHAAVVARGWGKCCVAGANGMMIDEKRKTLTIHGRRFRTDEMLSLDGSTGEVMRGEVPTVRPQVSGDFATLMKWADEERRLGVQANADTPKDAERARRYGAQGIGLCRTEHMFFEGKRILAMREMILADSTQERRTALAKLLPYQRSDFEAMFEAMKGLPVTIRLLDPPLHEFLPNDAQSQAEVARDLGVKPSKVKARVWQLHEANPMLGHRGCRLSITYPEVLEMQVSAIVQAAVNCRRRHIDARPEIMIPLVGIARELEILRERVLATVEQVMKDMNYQGGLEIPVGTMIEVPRAALTAEEIAAHADFFSFGTNDLTQMTLGYSRDDVNTFLPDYLQQGILANSPFQRLDSVGVGQLVEMAVERGRRTRKALKCGICGEHGGDPESIAFFDHARLDYVSCSPFRVPVARLAAAQAAIRGRRRSKGRR